MGLMADANKENENIIFNLELIQSAIASNFIITAKGKDGLSSSSSAELTSFVALLEESIVKINENIEKSRTLFEQQVKKAGAVLTATSGVVQILKNSIKANTSKEAVREKSSSSFSSKITPQNQTVPPETKVPDVNERQYHLIANNTEQQFRDPSRSIKSLVESSACSSTSSRSISLLAKVSLESNDEIVVPKFPANDVLSTNKTRFGLGENIIRESRSEHDLKKMFNINSEPKVNLVRLTSAEIAQLSRSECSLVMSQEKNLLDMSPTLPMARSFVNSPNRKHIMVKSEHPVIPLLPLASCFKFKNIKSEMGFQPSFSESNESADQLCEENTPNDTAHLNDYCKIVSKQNMCKICSKKFSSNSKVQRHIKAVHLLEKPHCCDFCKRSFSEKSQLRTHIKKVHFKIPKSIVLKHEVSEEEASIDFLSTDKYSQFISDDGHHCKLCNKQFAERDSLARHISSIHLHESTFQCGVCRKAFSRKDAFLTHCNVHFEIPMSSIIKDEVLDRKVSINLLSTNKYSQFISDGHRCKPCDKQFSERRSLIRHISSIHFKEQTFKCDECHKTYSREDYLETHKNSVHLNKINYHCDLCPQKFFTRKAFVYHKNSAHLKLYSRQCDICGKVVSSKSMRRHLRSKGCVKPSFDCKRCNNVYSNPQELNEHICVPVIVKIEATN